MSLGFTIIFALLLLPTIKAFFEGAGEVIGILVEPTLTPQQIENQEIERKLLQKEESLKFWKNRASWARLGYIDGVQHDEIDCKIILENSLEQIERLTT